MLPNEIRYALDFSPMSGVPYSAFVHAKYVEERLNFVLDNNARKLIASDRQLHEHGLRVVEDNVNQNFAILSEDIQDIFASTRRVNDQLDDISASLDNVAHIVSQAADRISSLLGWGFSELLTSLGRAHSSIENMNATLSNPSSTWADEHYLNAVVSSNNGWYEEALQSLRYAIDGQGSNTGIKTDFRYHLLAGRIYFGEFRNTPKSLIDLIRAEQAFLNAARYAQPTSNDIHGAALVYAGRCAFNLGEYRRAIDHLTSALRVVEGDAKSIYLLSKSYAGDKNFHEAGNCLAMAIQKSPSIALMAGSDPLFVSDFASLARAIDKATLHFLSQTNSIGNIVKDKCSAAMAYEFTKIRLSDLYQSNPVYVERLVDLSDRELATGTLFGAVRAFRIISNYRPVFAAWFDDYRQRLRAKIIRTYYDRLEAMPLPKQPNPYIRSVAQADYARFVDRRNQIRSELNVILEAIPDVWPVRL